MLLLLFGMAARARESRIRVASYGKLAGANWI